ncbi:MAG: bifunctional riboflavin kinase/FAD synthetase [Bacteroidetes bacterium]|nr:bifunctional riboflavin kinase/FAD synthetase [Bacteroidota bacterium]MBL6942842.1 bifunctional riboflavin kinase/FAD synthetase [Bacteroidales bacterium]
MKIYNCINDFKHVENAVVTIGTFDGVHLGHQAVFNQMKAEAEKINGETVVITFFPHPRIVLGLDSSNLKFIKTEKKKIQSIEKAGIDHLIIVEFTKEFASMPSEVFIKELIVDKIRPKLLIIGYDHQFGNHREGSFELLIKMSRQYGFVVKQVEAQNIGGSTISSTKIRNLLNQGNIAKANKLLGHEYSITGKVVKGKSIGHNLGFPTANIEVDDEYKLIAAVGVYACRVHCLHRNYKGMGNIGFRPTIDHGELTIEVNIFDFDKDIYGKEITISFVERMRDEHKFENIEALKEQLAKDKIQALKIL